MKPYIGIVHQDAGSAYGISFPDAPGCFSAADTLDDLSAIRHDLDWAESFEDAVLIIAVPSPTTRLQTAA